MGSIGDFSTAEPAVVLRKLKTVTGRRSDTDTVIDRPDLKVQDAATNQCDEVVNIQIPTSSSYGPLTILTTAWLIFVWRGSLGDQDENWAVSVKSSTSESTHDLKLQEFIVDNDQKIESILRNVAHTVNSHTYTDINDETISLCTAATCANNKESIAYSIECSIDSQTIRIRWQQHDPVLYKNMLRTHLSAFSDILNTICTSANETSVMGLLETTASELNQIWSWNKNLPQPISTGIHQYILEQAESRPNAEAVVSYDRNFTYTEIERFSRQLAIKLRALGVKEGSFVPLCFEKSAWTVVAVIAIIRAGAAFVLTDPSQPESRLQTIFDEVNSNIIVTSEKFRNLGSKLGAKEVVVVGPQLELSQMSDDQQPLKEFVPEMLYIIFTSGSTGKPKGVMISHTAYTTGAIPRADIVGYNQNTKVLDFASYAFDVSIDCMLLTLATGGCICVPSEDDRVNNLSSAIRKMNVNMLHTTPSIARVLDDDIIPSLRVLGLGGEAVPAHDASRWNEATQGGVVIAYGPSECTVGCTFCKFDEELVGKTYTSLGKGCGGCLWIVDSDDHDKLSPLGAVGELLVEGAIVGQGYLNEPEKTAAVFINAPEWLRHVPHSHTGREWSRLYKTGDLVRYDPHGTGAIVFVGRKDQQVKIRGQRVELEEVEYHLRQRLPSRTAAAAEVIRPGGDGDPILIAFIVENAMRQEEVMNDVLDFSPRFKELLQQLVGRLMKEVPRYMVPASFLSITQMPTMVSGKTNRKDLKARGERMSRKDLSAWRQIQREQQPNEPLTDEEQILSKIWSKVLGQTSEIGKLDNFFALGGDSLKAMRLVSLARQEGFNLSISTIFNHSTLVDMSQRLLPGSRQGEQPPAPFSLLRHRAKNGIVKEAAKLCELAVSEIHDILPCTPLQEGLIALSAKVPDAYVAQRVVKLGRTDAELFKKALNEVVAGCEILRTRVVYLPDHGMLQVVINSNATLHHNGSLQSYLADDRAASMSLGKPLCRMAFVHEPESETEHFAITMHHALYDGWSMPLIVNQINRSFEGQTLMKRTPFSQFVKYLHDIDQSAAERYWHNLLSGSATRQFPSLPHSDYQTKANSLLERQITVDDVTASSHTLATIIRASWALTVASFHGSTDIIFGETLTGRNADVAGIEEIEGPLITTVPMRVLLDGSMTQAELLEMILKQTVDRIPFEHLGLQNIRLLSKDARNACDLRTGFVLHPCIENEDSGNTEGPASALVPAGDLEAAQEALKFNSYALMMVCTLEKNGFLTMASFDSNTISKADMEAVLELFDKNVKILSVSSGQSLSTICPPLHRTKTKNSEESRRETVPDAVSISRSNSVKPISDEDQSKIATVQKICVRILRVDMEEVISVDDFFDLGGDSIGAMKLVSELRQNGYNASVADVFAQRKLSKMASKLQQPTALSETPAQPHNEHELRSTKMLDSSIVHKLLSDRTWDIETMYEARPLQTIAVTGTVDLPRYSVRYEILHLDGVLDKAGLHAACQGLFSSSEILRTTFVEYEDRCIAVVLKDVDLNFEEYHVENDAAEFARNFCKIDVQKQMSLGSQFTKFSLIESKDGECCLVFKLSHAQYDEVCLPNILDSLMKLYNGVKLAPSPHFSSFVEHIEIENIPRAIPYWKDLLKGSSIIQLPGPEIPIRDSRNLVSLTKRVSITKRPKNTTLATYPTAAWALCLSRRMQTLDVVFGEVLTGRNSGMKYADQVIGPCWQYSPTRVQMESTWTGFDLLSLIQTQHAVSSEFASMGLCEIVEQCTEWPKDTLWFDSVVHQAVKPIESLTSEGLKVDIETIYPHLEPLKEWKVQAFAGEQDMVLEIVTFAEWTEFGQQLLDDLVVAFEQLMKCPEQRLM